MNNNELKFQLADLKKVINKWLYIENDMVIDVIVATYIANEVETITDRIMQDIKI